LSIVTLTLTEFSFAQWTAEGGGPHNILAVCATSGLRSPHGISPLMTTLAFGMTPGSVSAPPC